MHETPVLQAFPQQFPRQANRENILRNREFLVGKQRILAHEALVRAHHNPGRTSSRIDADERLLCAAGSTDRRNTFCELLSWGLIEQGLSRPFIELPCDRTELGLAIQGQIGTARKILAQQSIGVFA